MGRFVPRLLIPQRSVVLRLLVPVVVGIILTPADGCRSTENEKEPRRIREVVYLDVPVHGVVSDATTGLPLDSAIVWHSVEGLTSTDPVAITDSLGRYKGILRLEKRIPWGTLFFDRDGYLSDRRSLYDMPRTPVEELSVSVSLRKRGPS
jgi:hypothetical protein